MDHFRAGILRIFRQLSKTELEEISYMFYMHIPPDETSHVTLLKKLEETDKIGPYNLGPLSKGLDIIDRKDLTRQLADVCTDASPQCCECEMKVMKREVETLRRENAMLLKQLEQYRKKYEESGEKKFENEE